MRPAKIVVTDLADGVVQAVQGIRFIPQTRPPRTERALDEQEAASILDLDGELRRVEGGGSGPWDGERAADLVNRITYLDSIRPESDPVSSAGESAFYWNATLLQCMEELEELRDEAASQPDSPSLQDTMKKVEEHGRRAGIIHHLFVEAIRAYKPQPSTE